MAETSKTIVLKGDPKNPESAEHHIEFPGGSISVCRTSKNEYWAHVWVNDGQVLDDPAHSKRGEIREVRMPDKNEPNHFAVLIGIER